MPTLSRRRLLASLASSCAVLSFTACSTTAPSGADPFTLGVASGDPDATSVVLWTRLAPDPFRADGGMPPARVRVQWEIARDEGMRQIVARGTVEAAPEEGHSLHIVAGGLEPGRVYWYRFATDKAQSRVGRTRTMPASGTRTDRFTLAIGGCQRIEQGFFTGWAEIAKADVDAVFHYGDYIYEYALQAAAISHRLDRPVGHAALPLVQSLDQYRLRYALYKLDPDLAAAHAAHPFLASFDDHEIANDWAGDFPGSRAMGAADFLKLRAAAFQAFYENSPLRPAHKPRGASIKAYRAIEVGDLLRLAVLDTRQYRSPPACGKSATQTCDERYDEKRSMIGAEQERWLLDLFARGDKPWTVLGNQVPMMQRLLRDPAHDMVDTDKWDGHVAARDRLLEAAAARKLSGLVAFTGDVHRAYVGELKSDYRDSEAATVGSEFVVSSMSSAGDGSQDRATGNRLKSANPHLRFYDARRGFAIARFTPKRCETDYRAIDKVSVRSAAVRSIATFAVDPKRPGIADTSA